MQGCLANWKEEWPLRDMRNTRPQTIYMLESLKQTIEPCKVLYWWCIETYMLFKNLIFELLFFCTPNKVIVYRLNLICWLNLFF